MFKILMSPAKRSESLLEKTLSYVINNYNEHSCIQDRAWWDSIEHYLPERIRTYFFLTPLPSVFTQSGYPFIDILSNITRLQLLQNF